MRTLTVFCAGMLMLAMPLCMTAQVYSYTTNTLGAPNAVAANAVGDSLVRVNGAGTPASPCGSGFTSNTFSSTPTFSTTLAAVEFTVTPDVGYQLSLTSITSDQRRSGSGPAATRYAYSLDGGANWIDAGGNNAPGNGSCTTAAVPALWNFADFSSATTVVFRIYGFTATSTNGNFQILNLTLEGTVDPLIVIPGCIDPTACNYDPAANTDDGSCIDSGCTDNGACNYDAAAGCDDGSCCFNECETLVVTDGEYPSEISWTLSDPLGNVIATGGANYTGTFCIVPGCQYVFDMFDSYPDGWNGATYTFTNGAGEVDATGTMGDGAAVSVFIHLGQGTIPGCMDSFATNYNASANCDDGSCIYCPPGEALYMLNFYDSYGDGWNGGQMVIANFGGDILFSGTMLSEYVETVLICLPSDCYTITVTGGFYPLEIGWELADPLGTVLLSGGAPVTNIGFSVGGTPCTIGGCTDTGCNNYNQFATFEDGTCQCPPANDDCANPESVTCGSSVIGTFEFTNDDSGTYLSDCGVGLDGPGVWYTLIGTGDQVTLSTCGTAVDTRIHVFTGIGCGNLVCDAANDDYAGCLGFAAQLTFTSVNGMVYTILISPYGGPSNEVFQFDVLCQPCTGSQANDECAGAFQQFSGVPFEQNLCCTNPDNSDCLGFQTGYGTWYYMNSSQAPCGCADTFDFYIENLSGANVGMTVYEDLGNLGCSNLVNIGCCPVTTGVCGGNLNATLECNTDYYFNVYTTDPVNCGDIRFTTTLGYMGCTDPNLCVANFDPCANIDDGSCLYSCAPANDDCVNATVVPCDTTLPNETTGGSTSDGSTLCGSSDNGVWYLLPVGNGDTYTVSTCGSTIDSRIQILEGSCGAFVNCVADESSDLTSCGFFDQNDASITFISNVGSTYYVLVTSQGFDGAFNISLSCVPTVVGCMSSLACNYNPLANWESGLCEYFSCLCTGADSGFTLNMYDAYGDGWNGGSYMIADNIGNVLAAGTCDDGDYVVDEDSYVGCESAFDLICLPDGCYTITVDGSLYPTSVSWSLVDEFGNAVASGGEETVAFSVGGVCGCTDNTACNWNPLATVDDGSCCNALCTTLTVMGGSYPQDISWQLVDELGNVVLSGGAPYTGTACLDQCTYTFNMYDSFGGNGWSGGIYTFTDSGGNEFATGTLADGTSGSATITSPLCGCTDLGACNYDAAVITDDGSCCYENCASLILSDTWLDGWNGATYTITDASTGTLYYTGTLATGAFEIVSLCLVDGCYNIVVTDGLYPIEVGWSIVGANDAISGGASADANFSMGTGNCTLGCTEPAACNYDPAAGLSDCDTCEYISCEGCTYSCADNYNPAALIDDGSCTGCEPACPADFDENGVINVSDLLFFMSVFGTFC